MMAALVNSSNHTSADSDGVDWVSRFSETVSLPTILGSAVALVLTIALCRRFLSPLKDIPGPFWASITRLWHVKIIIDGNQNVRLRDAHEEYGPFVRMAPNEVSVTHPDGVKRLLLQALPKVRIRTGAGNDHEINSTLTAASERVPFMGLVRFRIGGSKRRYQPAIRRKKWKDRKHSRLGTPFRT